MVITVLKQCLIQMSSSGFSYPHPPFPEYGVHTACQVGAMVLYPKGTDAV
jgi:hypothetical protein